MFLSTVYNAFVCFHPCCLQAISVLLVALNIVYLLVDETALPKGSKVRKMQVNKPENGNKYSAFRSLARSLAALQKARFASGHTEFQICSGVCCKRKDTSRCVSCRCCLMLFTRVALPFALLDVNSKALTHHMCVKLWTQTSFVLTGCF